MVQSWLRIGVLLLVFLSIVLPSGSVYGLNIKVYLAFIIVFFLIADGVLTNSMPSSIVILSCVFALFLTSSITVALTGGVQTESIKSETLAFSSVVAIVLFVIYVVDKRYVRREAFLRFLFNVSVAHCVIKIFFEVLLISGFMAESTLRYGIPEIFGADILLLDYGFFYRINTSGDFILPLAVLMSASPDIAGSGRKRAVGAAVILFSIFLTYSRYLWLYGAVAAFIAYVVGEGRHRSGGGVRRYGVRIAKAATVGAMALALLVAAGWADAVVDRFTGNSAISSDGQRMEMFFPLLQKFMEKPLMGTGMGGYVEDVIRVERLPWNYELEWLSFAMQFGLFGLFMLLIAATAPLVLYSRARIAGVAFAVMYSLWIGVGLFNSFLLTSAAGVVFAAFVVFGKYVVQEEARSTGEKWILVRGREESVG